MLDDMYNSSLEGRNTYPNTVTEAYRRALTYHEDGRPVAYKAYTRILSEPAVFHRGERKDKKDSKSRKVYLTADGGGKAKEGFVHKTYTKPKARLDKDTCAFCKKKGHWKRECPLLK